MNENKPSWLTEAQDEVEKEQQPNTNPAKAGPDWLNEATDEANGVQTNKGTPAGTEKQVRPWWEDENGDVDLSRYDPKQEKVETNTGTQTDVNTKKTQEYDPTTMDPEWFDTKAVKTETKGLVYEEQVNNKPLIDALKRRFGEHYSNKELIEKWAGEQHFINWNLTRLVYDASTLKSLTKQEKEDYLLMFETWDKVKSFGEGSQSFWDQLKEIGGALLSDGTTYVGIGTLGIGLAGKFGGKAVTKEAIKAFLRDSLKTRVAIGAVEAGAYGAADDVARQTIEQVGSGKAEDFSEVTIDKGRTATVTTIATVTGGVVTFGADKLLRKEAGKVGDALNNTEAEKVVNTPEVKPTDASEPVVETLDAPNTQPEATTNGLPQAPEGREYVQVDFEQLPKDLKGAKPTYKRFKVTFENDVQKAVYIGSNRTKPSKRQADYMAFAMKELGMTEEQVYKLGDAMRAKMENEWAGQPDKSGGTLAPKFDFFPEQKVIDRPKVEVKPGETKTDGTTTGETKTDGTATETPKVEDDLTKPLTDEEKKLAEETVTTEKQPASTMNRNRTLSSLTEEELDKIEATLREDPTVIGNDVTYSRARAIVVDVVQDAKKLDEFLNKVTTSTIGMTENMVAVRMLVSSVQNKIASEWTAKMTPMERVGVYFKYPEYFRLLETTTKLAQRNAAEAGRTLQAHSIEVNMLGDLVDKLSAKNKKVSVLSKEADAKGLTGDAKMEYIQSAFGDKEWKDLEKVMEELVAQNEAYRNSLHNPLPAFDKNENLFTKVSRVAAEIWTSANLFNTGTQIGALVGTGLKRMTMKAESYMQYMIGKGAVLFGGDPKAHLRWRQVQEINTANWAQSFETFKMMGRLFSSQTGEGVEAQIQRESLDGWVTKWDDNQTKGAINSDYIGFQNPQNVFTSMANKLLDGAGVFTRGSFTALSLMDDVMKRVYYRPFIRMKAAGIGLDKGLKGDALDLFINDYDRAYTLFYQKKGQRENTKRVVMAREMEKFNKANPDADNVAKMQAEVEANKIAEAEIAFTQQERELLDRVGIDSKIHEEAMVYLREMLFQSEISGPISDAAKALRDAHPLMQTQLPYLKTVMNMTKDTFQRLPGTNLFFREVRADLAAGGMDRDKRIAQMMVGTAWISSGYLLFKEGYITPSTDPSQYGVEDTTNLKGSSINVPGLGSIPLNRIEPVGSFFRLSADYYEIYNEYERIKGIIEQSTTEKNASADLEQLEKLKDEWMVSFLGATMKVFSEKSGAESIRKIMNMIENPTSDSAQQFFNQLVSGVVPARSGIQQIMQDDVMYEAKSFGEHFRKQLGIQSEKYGDREKIDLFGLPNVEVTRNAVNWRTSNPDPKDDVEKEIWALKPNLRSPDNIVTLPNGVKIELDYKEHYELRKMLADSKINAKGQFEKIIKDPRYARLPDGISDGPDTGPWKSKTSMLEHIYRKSKEAAKALYVQKNLKFLEEKYKGQLNNMKKFNETGTQDERRNIFEMFGQ